MRKILLIAIVATIVAGFIVPAIALDTQQITVTLAPNATASIACNQSVWAPSCGLGNNISTAATWGNITNTGAVSVIVKVKGTNTDAWTIGDPATYNVFKMTCTPAGDSAVVLTTDDQTFVSSLANAAVKDFGLQVWMPISSSTNASQTVTVTFTATAL